MKVIVGNPVKGEDFYGREREQSKMLELLRSDNILMLAPRRVGKTSMLREFERTGYEHGFHAFNCSFAGCSDELDCINEIYRAIGRNEGLRARLVEATKKYLGKIKAVNVPGGLGLELKDVDRTQWRQIGEGLIEALTDLGKQEKLTPVVCIDEVPIFVLKLLRQENGKETARGFLNWFRNVRQQNSENVRWILAGSIGLDTILSMLKMSDTINDLVILPIGEFDERSAHGLLERLSESYEIVFPKDARQHLIQRVGWPIPYYLQLMFSAIKDTLLPLQDGVSGPYGTISIDDVDDAFETLLNPVFRNKFEYWHQRLSQELETPDDKIAILLLNSACVDAAGVDRSTMSQAIEKIVPNAEDRNEKLNYLLQVLQSEGYLVETEGRFTFRAALLREFWKRRIAS